MSDAGAVAFLATVPLLQGMPDAELAELARVMRRRRLRRGDVLWREGDEAQGMVLIVEGTVRESLRLPGERVFEVATLGPGETLGDVPLLDGGVHSATAQATEGGSVLFLSRAEFGALVTRRHATAFAVKRQIARLACGRLRTQLAALAESLGGELADEHAPLAELEFCGPPNSGYVRRLANFRAFDSLALWGVLTAGRYARCPAGSVLVAEGDTSGAFSITINGAVEKVIVRGGRRIRVGLAGPGLGFGYETLVDGGPSPVTAATRERTLLLMVPREAFDRLFGGDTPEAHVFLDLVLRDITTALRQALRPHARLAASVASRPAWAADRPEPG